MKKKTLMDTTKDEYNCFKPGYKIMQGSKYVTVEYLTNILGDCDKTYKIPIDEWYAITTPRYDIDLNKLRCITVEIAYNPVKQGKEIE